MAGIEKMTAGLLDTLGVEHALYTQGSMPSHSPLTGEQIAAVRIADAADTDAALAAAGAAFRAWRDVPAPRRGELVRLFG